MPDTLVTGNPFTGLASIDWEIDHDSMARLADYWGLDIGQTIQMRSASAVSDGLSLIQDQANASLRDRGEHGRVILQSARITGSTVRYDMARMMYCVHSVIEVRGEITSTNDPLSVIVIAAVLLVGICVAMDSLVGTKIIATVCRVFGSGVAAGVAPVIGLLVPVAIAGVVLVVVLKRRKAA